MKVGIITFHWATNYGAVLQTYALQTYLETRGLEAEIINYYPEGFKPTALGCMKSKTISGMRRKRKEYGREKAIALFRSQKLHETIRYKSEEELKNTPPSFDVYISGSDQIWNPYFTMNGEGNVTLPYYLSFAQGKRIAYASSFGVPEIPTEMKAIVAKELMKFDNISVRENSGKDILEALGVNAQVVPDPTLLLRKEKYLELIHSEKSGKPYGFSFILHEQSGQAALLQSEMERFYGCAVEVLPDTATVEEWLSYIKNAEFVLTNSFHCTVFAMVFKVPFVTFEAGGPCMGDRMRTLLTSVGLENRFIHVKNADKVKEILEQKIEWEKVDLCLEKLRNTGEEYLSRSLEIKKCDKSVLTVPSNRCTGCGLCAAVCPVQCIQLTADSEGFRVPQIDIDRCLNCGLCKSQCVAISSINTESSFKEPNVYSGWHTDPQIRYESSSGGAFTALAETILKKEGVVFGAAYTGPMLLEHIPVETVENLKILRGSKYFQSHTESAFPILKKYLSEGKWVLFVGTPCQIAAVKTFTRNPSNLFCVDLACHGVPSDKIMAEFCDLYSKKVGEDIVRIDFRDKVTGWSDFSLTMYARNNKRVWSTNNSKEPYFRGYVDDLFLRPSCIDCKFACVPRQGDITLADSWHFVHEKKDAENKGISAILINSAKGAALFSASADRLHCEKDVFEDVVRGTPLLIRGASANPNCEKFWSIYRRDGYKKAIKELEGPETLLKKIKRHLSVKG